MMTLEICAAYADSKGFRYFGTEYGRVKAFDA
jgi:hypothetical protein